MNALLAEMRAEAMAVVAAGGFGAATTETRTAFMRYVGQGHEIPVPLPARLLAPRTWPRCARVTTRNTPGSTIARCPGSDVEIMSYAVVVATVADDADAPCRCRATRSRRRPRRPARGWCATPTTGEVASWAVYDRAALAPGAQHGGAGDHRRGRDVDPGLPGLERDGERAGYIEMTREGA